MVGNDIPTCAFKWATCGAKAAAARALAEAPAGPPSPGGVARMQSPTLVVGLVDLTACHGGRKWLPGREVRVWSLYNACALFWCAVEGDHTCAALLLAGLVRIVLS